MKVSGGLSGYPVTLVTFQGKVSREAFLPQSIHGFTPSSVLSVILEISAEQFMCSHHQITQSDGQRPMNWIESVNSV